MGKVFHFGPLGDQMVTAQPLHGLLECSQSEAKFIAIVDMTPEGRKVNQG